MSTGHLISCLRPLKAVAAGCLLIFVASCTVVKQYPRDKPFVYKTNINLIGNFSNEERLNLEDALEAQLDDSIRVKSRQQLFWSVLKKPSLYDSTDADKSIIFMRALLVSLGYFRDSISYSDTVIRQGKHELRTYVDFRVEPGKRWLLDSIGYNLSHPDLQAIAQRSREDAIIKRGSPFAKGPVSAEIDRLTELYRDSGYLRFTRDGIVALWDTLDVALLQPSLDPFEQLELLQRLRARRDSPTANLEFRLRDIDSARLTKYYNGTVTVYPDFTIDTVGRTRQETIVKGIKVVQYRNKFKPTIFPANIYLPRGAAYRQRRYIRTVNRLNVIGAWQLVNIETVPRRNEDTVDYIIRLTPAKKRQFSANLEGSFNQSAISGNLFGVGINIGLENRNFLRAANQASTNLRYGVEFGASGSNQFIQTQQASITNNIYFPRAIFVEKLIGENRRDNWKSIFSTTVANTDRRFLYNLTTLNASLAYEYQFRNKLLNIKFPFPNIEYSFLDRRDSLNRLIEKNPSLRNIFTDGLIFSWIGSLTVTGGKKNNLNVLRVNAEGAPLFAGWIHTPFLDSQIYRFMKVDLEIARLIRYKKKSIALRLFGGLGIADPFNSTVNAGKRNALPFFKQYFSGGSNSMRAWSLRRLGPGSTIKEFSETPDRYGDVQLEANAEFRFPIFKPFGIPVNGALFTDIGNVWLLKAKAGDPEEVFRFDRLGKDIAVGAGAGLRFDLGFFVIRLDYSYKVKDPSPSPENAHLQNKWFGYSFFQGDQFQLGIGYPFIF